MAEVNSASMSPDNSHSSLHVRLRTMSIRLSGALRAAPRPLHSFGREGALRPQWLSKRTFAAAPRLAIAVNEMGEKDFASLRIDQQRLMDELHKTCEWGKGERWGE